MTAAALDVFHQLPRSVAGWNDTATSINNDTANGLSKPPWWFTRYRPELVLEKCVRSKTAPSNRNVLGTVAMWGHLTTAQVATATGLTPARTLNTLRRLHVAGLLRRTSLVLRRSRAPQLEVWSLSPDSAEPLRAIRRRVPLDTWTNVTAGWPPRPSPLHSWAHDVLAAETALRCIRHGDLTVAWGVHSADHGLLAGIGRSTGRRQNPVADAVLIRPDGLPVALEIQRNVNEPAIDVKIQRWIDLIRTHGDHAPAVIWVVCDDAAAPNRRLHRRLKVRIAELVRANPIGAIRHQIAERIGVIHWTDWFPAVHETADAAASLTVQRPTGPIGNPWNIATMIDPLDVTFIPRDVDWWNTGIARSLDWDGSVT